MFHIIHIHLRTKALLQVLFVLFKNWAELEETRIKIDIPVNNVK
jgi:hypothetical protein